MRGRIGIGTTLPQPHFVANLFMLASSSIPPTPIPRLLLMPQPHGVHVGHKHRHLSDHGRVKARAEDANNNEVNALRIIQRDLHMHRGGEGGRGRVRRGEGKVHSLDGCIQN